MGNQQAKVEDICWFAGFADGEGSISFMNSRVKYLGEPYLFYYPRFRVSNTHIETLNYVTQILDNIGVGYNVSWKRPNNLKWHTSWTINIQGMKRVDKLLLIITPYLKTKYETAIRIQSWIQLRLKHKVSNQHIKYDPYSSQELQLMKEVREMNHH